MTKRLLTARTAFLSVCAVTLALGFVVPTGAGAQTSNNPIPGIDVIVRKCPPGNCMAICGQKTCNGKTQQPATSGRAAHQDYGPRPLDDGSNFRKGSGRGSGSTPQPAGRDGSMWVGGDFGAKSRRTKLPRAASATKAVIDRWRKLHSSSSGKGQQRVGSRAAAPPDSAMEIFTSPVLTVAATAEKVVSGPLI
jgi:hypothetical protein